MNDLADSKLTERIIGCAFKVHTRLGHGFLERVYKNAMRIELTKEGLAVQQQAPIPVYYEGQAVGEYFADLLVDNKVLCELKAGLALAPEHEAQLVNYLAATGFDTGLLLNFGKSVTVRRKFKQYRKPRSSGVLSEILDPAKSC